MKQPYEMTRLEWNEIREKNSIDGMPRYASKYGGRGETISKLNVREFLAFGVQKWLTEKAENGNKEALFLLEYGYDTFSMVLIKAKEEGLISEINDEIAIKEMNKLYS